MSKRRRAEPLIQTVERALDPGRFVSYGASWRFAQQLEEVKSDLDALVEAGEAQRAVDLYELFLAGCYDKAEEIDDSGGTLGQFFAELFVSWIKARQKAGCRPEETVNLILRWMENDDYGFCFDIEEEVAKALDREGGRLLRQHVEDRFEEAFAPLAAEEPRQPPHRVRQTFTQSSSAGSITVVDCRFTQLGVMITTCCSPGIVVPLADN